MAANKQAKQKLLLDALRAGNTLRASAAYAQVSQETYYQWRRESLKFSEEADASLATAEIRAVAGIIKAGQKSWQALAWWLEHNPRTKGDWKRISEINWRDISAEQLLLLAGDHLSEPESGQIAPPTSPDTLGDGKALVEDRLSQLGGVIAP